MHELRHAMLDERDARRLSIQMRVVITGHVGPIVHKPCRLTFFGLRWICDVVMGGTSRSCKYLKARSVMMFVRA